LPAGRANNLGSQLGNGCLPVGNKQLWLTPIAFNNEGIQTFVFVFFEFADDSQLHQLIGRLLQIFSGYGLQHGIRFSIRLGEGQPKRL
jgi:hypothetical protein